jgi:hypothetical protein
VSRASPNGAQAATPAVNGRENGKAATNTAPRACAPRARDLSAERRRMHGHLQPDYLRSEIERLRFGTAPLEDPSSGSRPEAAVSSKLLTTFLQAPPTPPRGRRRGGRIYRWAPTLRSRRHRGLRAQEVTGISRLAPREPLIFSRGSHVPAAPRGRAERSICSSLPAPSRTTRSSSPTTAVFWMGQSPTSKSKIGTDDG